MRRRCYYCGEPASSVEHAPPEQMFEGLDCDRITVPSCKDHNSKKSGHDQAIVHGFLKSLSLQPPGGGASSHPDVVTAIQRVQPGFSFTKNRAKDSPLTSDPRAANLPNTTYLIPEVRIHAWVRQLTAALVCYALDKKFEPSIHWEKSTVGSPNWLSSPSQDPLMLEDLALWFNRTQLFQRAVALLEWKPGWSAWPRPYPIMIYRFEYSLSENFLAIRHRFYDSFDWYCWLSVSTSAATRFAEAARSLVDRQTAGPRRLRAKADTLET